MPSQFNHGNVKDESNMATWGSLTLFVDFHGFFTSKEPYLFPYLPETPYIFVFSPNLITSMYTVKLLFNY